MIDQYKIVGYYPNWVMYGSHHEKYTPADIDYSKFTTIIYAFFIPEADGSLSSSDAWSDEKVLLGDQNWQTSTSSKCYYIPGTSLVDRAHEQGCKVYLSIGGWANSQHFPAVAADAKTRERFAKECVELIKKYNVDGVDIDWEYPGYVPHGGSYSDYSNYVRLLGEIRKQFTEHNLKADLTITLLLEENQQRYTNFEKVQALVDQIHLFTFDFMSQGVVQAYHDAPLYTKINAPVTESLDLAVKQLASLGVENSKIIVGIPFFGKTFTSADYSIDLGARHQALPDTNYFPESKGIPSYRDIKQRQAQFDYYWDNDAKASYMLAKNRHSFITFNDENTLKEKVNYIIEKKLGGCFIWEISGDVFYSPDKIISTPLLDQLQKLKQ